MADGAEGLDAGDDPAHRVRAWVGARSPLPGPESGVPRSTAEPSDSGGRPLQDPVETARNVETMRSLGKVALTVVALASLTAPAWSQQPGSPGGLGGGPFLLIVPNVQEELKLTGEQIQTLPQIHPSDHRGSLATR